MFWLAHWFWMTCLAIAMAWPLSACAQTGAGQSATAQPGTGTATAVQKPTGNPTIPAVTPALIPNPAATPPANVSGKSGRVTELPKGVPGDIIYLPGPDGELVPVPAGATLREYLEWLQKKGSTNPAATATDSTPAPATAPPNFDITSVSLEGTADDERARLTARIRVQLPRADEWVRVPLELSEAVLRGSSYKGSGESIPDRQAESGPGDYAWWFRGRGEHELTLDLSVPLVPRQLPRRRLQLSLPPTVVSSLKLRVPHPGVQASGGVRGAISVRTVGNDSEIEVFGMKEDLDLSWQTAPAAEIGEAVLETSTTIQVNLTEGEPVALTATQQIQALQGKFAELAVELPGGFDLEKVDGKEYLDHRSDPAKPGTTIVRLKKPTAGPVELQWTLRGSTPAENSKFTISGFDVRGSRVKEGFIVLQLMGDFQLLRHSKEERHVRRIYPNDLPARLRTSSATAQFRFLAQPFRLVFSLLKVEPFVTVEPVMFLGFSAEQVELEGVFSFYVSRGSMSTVDLIWPKQAQAEWTALSVGPLELVKLWEPTKDGIRIHLHSPAKEACQIRLHASRAFVPAAVVGTGAVAGGSPSAAVAPGAKPAELPPVQLSLPFSRVPGVAPTLIDAFIADNIDLDLRGASGTILRAQPTPLSKVSTPREMQSLRRLAYRLESGPPNFTAGVTRHARKIVTETDAVVTASRGDLSVRQRIVYDIAYDRLSQLRLTLPPGLRHEGVQLLSDKGAPIDPTVRRSAASSVELICPLDVPRSGRLEIEARYRLVAPQSRSQGVQNVSIPLLGSLDAPFSGMRFVWQDPAGREAKLAGDTWSRQPASDGLPSWISSGNASSVSLSLSKPVSGTVLSRGLLRSVVDSDGRIATRAQYRVSSLQGPLSVAFPEGVQPTAIWWNRQQVTAIRIGETSDGTRNYEIPAPDRTTTVKDHLLSIDYHVASTGPQRGVGILTLPAPHFQGETWLNSVLWEVLLPANEHLLQRPIGVSPEYRWSWYEYFFSRRSTLGPKALADWIGEEDGPEPLLAGGPNAYLFSQCGPAPEMIIRTMSQSAIVLVGAGLALAAGFVLVRIPSTRHAVSLLTVLFALAIAGLWFPEPVLLLLQPAGIGLVLAVIAAWGDSRLWRRRETGITLVPPSGYHLPAHPGSSINRDRLPSIGTEEYTINRSLPDESSVGQFRSSASEQSV